MFHKKYILTIFSELYLNIYDTVRLSKPLDCDLSRDTVNFRKIVKHTAYNLTHF